MEYPLFTLYQGYSSVRTATATISHGGQYLTVINENVTNEDDFIPSAYHFNLYYIWQLSEQGMQVFTTPFGTLEETQLSQILATYMPIIGEIK